MNENNINDINCLNGIDTIIDYKTYHNIMENLHEMFKSIGIFNDLNIYVDNLTSINYVFNNSIKSIKLYCINKLSINKSHINLSTLTESTSLETNLSDFVLNYNPEPVPKSKLEEELELFELELELDSEQYFEPEIIQIIKPINFLYIQNKVKQLGTNNANYKIKFISRVSNNIPIDKNNFKNKKYRQLDMIKFMYEQHDLINPIIIEMYFFNANIFDNPDDNFTNLICDDFFYTLVDNTISSLYYCVEDKKFYSIKTNEEIKNIDCVGKIITNEDFNLKMLISNPEVFFEIFSYYLITRNEIFKSIIKLFIEEYQKNKIVKKKIKYVFNWKKKEYIDNLYKLVNIIKKYSLEIICLNIIKELPVINKLLFGLSSELDYYGLNIYDTFDTYIITSLFVKNKIFSRSDYLEYVKKTSSETDGFDFVFDNKLEIVKKFKLNPFVISDISVQTKYPHYYKINQLCEILYVLLYCGDELTSNIESLKLSYIFKKFYYLNHGDLKYIIGIYNNILLSLKNKNKNDCVEQLNIRDDNYFWTMCDNYLTLIDLENTFFGELTEINKKFACSIDIIDIYDYQNSMYLLIELIYLNKLNLDDKKFLKLNADEYLQSVIANIRSNKLLNNNNNSDNDVYDSDDDTIDSTNDIMKKYICKYTNSDYTNSNDTNCSNSFRDLDEMTDTDMKNYLDKFMKIFMSSELSDDIESNDIESNDIESIDINDNDNDNIVDVVDNVDDILMSMNILDNGENIEDDENIEDYFINSNYKSSKSKKTKKTKKTNLNSNNIFFKITDNIDDLIHKMNEIVVDEKISDTSDTSDILDTYQSNLFTNDVKFLKYQKYKNKYIRFKNIYQIIKTEYFDINIFISGIKSNIPVNKILDIIFDFYGFSELEDDNKINEPNKIIDLNIIGLNNIISIADNFNQNEIHNINTDVNEVIDEISNTVDYDGTNNNYNTTNYEEIKLACEQIIEELITKIEQSTQ